MAEQSKGVRSYAIKPGSLNRRCMLYRRHDNAVGEYETTSSQLAKLAIWCDVQPVSGATYYGSQQVGDAVTHRIVMRYVPSVTDPHTLSSDHEITYAGYRYRVARVYDYMDMRRYVICDCTVIGKED